MFNKKSVYVPAAAALLALMIVSGGILRTRRVSAANPQNPEAFLANSVEPCGGYGLASLQGHYAIVVTYGANVAVALAQRYFDGSGHLTGTFLLNAPLTGSETGERKITTGTQVGTYTVNCDGSGKITRTLTTSTGQTSTQVDDFIITGTVYRALGTRGQTYNLATSIADATEVPSALVPGGIFVTRSYTRLPN